MHPLVPLVFKRNPEPRANLDGMVESVHSVRQAGRTPNSDRSRSRLYRYAHFAVPVALAGILVSPDRSAAAHDPQPIAAPRDGSAAQGPVHVRASTEPPAPEPPDVLSRDDTGRATVRAVYVSEPLRIDGKLDEPIYQSLASLGGFIQSLPTEGAPASERTEAWVMFDGNNVYISARCWDSAPPSQWVANELRRDTNQLRQNDTFSVMFDTFYDHRNGFVFYTNPLGALADFVYTDESNINQDWNPVWEVRTGRFEGGWTVEMAIPFKSLRYRSGDDELWGLQLRRAIRRKNEWSYLTAIPISVGMGGISRSSAAATLVGLRLPPASKNLEFKPYATSRVTTDRVRAPVVLNDLDATGGFDVKYGITANLTADATYNTDFAQVEIDEQQVNLTRFSLFFPEKREFFLEGRGIMDFGRPTGDIPALYYSRRIGFNAGRVVPIELGGRVTGKVGDFGLGVLNIRTESEATAATPATNFTVLRVRRDILRRSTIGAMFTNRSEAVLGDGSNQGYGVDALFALLENVSVQGYLAATKTPGIVGDDQSARAAFDYTGDRYGLSAQYLMVGRNFNPEVGFVRRSDFRRTFLSARFSPRPANIKHVRKFTWEATLDYVENGAGQLESREQTGRFNTEFENSDQLAFQASNQFEMLLRPFPIAPRVTVPMGSYLFPDGQVSYTLGQQRRVSGTVAVQRGGFYDGTITGLSYTTARISVIKPLSVEPTIAINRVELPAGNFTTRLLRARTDYAFSPRMFVSALLQYNSSDNSFSSNLRFRWEYRPGSELFAVYTDEHDTLGPRLSLLKNRAFVLKINRLFRF
jgi:hypothetical protein